MEKLILSRREILTLGAAAILTPQTAAAATGRPVLIELFTSQGCSSCPPADIVASELVNDPNNLVLSFNVDYWDYLGWRDTLAKPEYSQRQYDYAKSRGDGSVYTPQMVVNGRAHVVGSKKRAVSQQIEESRNIALIADVKLTSSDHSVSISVPATNFDGEATLWLMAIEPRVKQKIEKGENAGRDVVYINVVRNLIPAGMWDGSAFRGTWMRDVVFTNGATTCIAVLQEGKTGAVLGLARL